MQSTKPHYPGLTTNVPGLRQVLECASLLAPLDYRPALEKRQKTAALQDAVAFACALFGSGSPLAGKIWRFSLTMNVPGLRQVLECASPLAPFPLRPASRKRSRRIGTALQDAVAPNENLFGSWSQCAGDIGGRAFGARKQ